MAGPRAPSGGCSASQWSSWPCGSRVPGVCIDSQGQEAETLMAMFQALMVLGDASWTKGWNDEPSVFRAWNSSLPTTQAPHLKPRTPSHHHPPCGVHSSSNHFSVPSSIPGDCPLCRTILVHCDPSYPMELLGHSCLLVGILTHSYFLCTPASRTYKYPPCLGKGHCDLLFKEVK
jgi:hypothetical protein